MIYVPFIYFSLLSIFIYRRNRELDIALLTSLVYATSGFFAILNDLFDLRHQDVANYEISIEATFAYCGLLTLCVVPLIFNSHLRITGISPINNGRPLKFLAWFSFIWFLLSTILDWNSITNVLTGDMQAYRANVYAGWGQESWMASLPTPIRFICALFNLILGCKWGLLFLAFFSLCIQKLQKKYFLLFFISSLSGPLDGITIADRSATAYWIMSFIAMYIIFRPKMDGMQKKHIFSLGLFLVFILSIYLSAMTIARFEDRDYGSTSGTQGSLISYFGQSYVNFCYYFDNYEPPFIHMGIIFPFFFEQILGIPTGGTAIQAQMSDATGLWTGVFYTFIGQIIMGAGKTVAVIYCFVYALASSICLRTIIHRKEVSSSSLYLYFAFASVIYLGLFGHYYAKGILTFGLLSIYAILRIMESTSSSYSRESTKINSWQLYNNKSLSNISHGTTN